MNGGAYWRALERFARDVCVRTDVRCVTYRELTKALDETPSLNAGGIAPGVDHAGWSSGGRPACSRSM